MRCCMRDIFGDLRKAVDLELVKDRTYHYPPFPLYISVTMMREIAHGMRLLHEGDILHRDLKAANVLLHKDFEIFVREGKGFVGCAIADFESCGVIGTRFWRAPEILLAVKNEVKDKPSDSKIWTKKVDVYGYAMTCYEVLTGCTPFENRGETDYDGVVRGGRPLSPDYVDLELRGLLRRCWHSKPSMRPTFKEIGGRIEQIHFEEK